MSKLNAAKRNALPSRDFAVAGRKFPINDANHARNALARASGTSVEGEVRRKVHAKFPGIGEANHVVHKSVGGTSAGKKRVV